jgi:hypothetical protein
MQELGQGVTMFFTKGWRKVGKGLMRRGWGLCKDNGFAPRAHAMMEEAEVPENWETIPSDESTPIGQNPYPPPPVFEGPDAARAWLDDGAAWRNYWDQSAPTGDARTDYSPYADPGYVARVCTTLTELHLFKNYILL